MPPLMFFEVVVTDYIYYSFDFCPIELIEIIRSLTCLSCWQNQSLKWKLISLFLCLFLVTSAGKPRTGAGPVKVLWEPSRARRSTLSRSFFLMPLCAGIQYNTMVSSLSSFQHSITSRNVFLTLFTAFRAVWLS